MFLDIFVLNSTLIRLPPLRFHSVGTISFQNNSPPHATIHLKAAPGRLAGTRQVGSTAVSLQAPRTDQKENQIFLICKEFHNGEVAKSFMTNGLLIYGEIFAHFLKYYEALPRI